MSRTIAPTQFSERASISGIEFHHNHLDIGTLGRYQVLVEGFAVQVESCMDRNKLIALPRNAT
jgi:hypothetical protein